MPKRRDGLTGRYAFFREFYSQEVSTERNFCRLQSYGHKRFGLYYKGSASPSSAMFDAAMASPPAIIAAPKVAACPHSPLSKFMKPAEAKIRPAGQRRCQARKLAKTIELIRAMR